ncbi:MAG: hypothetical protein BGN88_14810 [Clostridiales bacterium 43-6]|nr:MAG: hypothetical protein BGN88_14810 [Clostridiales bacterium 43-6]
MKRIAYVTGAICIVLILVIIFSVYNQNKNSYKTPTQKTEVKLTTQTIEEKSTQMVTTNLSDKKLNEYMANNYLGSGIVCKKDNYQYTALKQIYYQKPGSDRLESLISSANPDIRYRNITINDDWIYYIEYKPDWSEPSILYKTKLDGSKRSLVCENIYTYILYNGYIYYVTNTDYSLCRIGVDGNNKMTLIDGEKGEKPVSKFYIENDRIYLSMGNDEYVSYINLDGTNLTKTKLEIGYINAGWIYYTKSINNTPYANICRQNIQSGKSELLIEKVSGSGRFNLFNNNIYYSFEGFEKYVFYDIYCYNIDNKTSKLIYKGSSVSYIEAIDITDDYIYLTGQDFESHYIDTVRISLKETKKQERFDEKKMKWVTSTEKIQE